MVVRKAGDLVSPTPARRERAALQTAKRHLAQGHVGTALSVLVIHVESQRVKA